MGRKKYIQQQKKKGMEWSLLPVLVALCLIPFIVKTIDYQTNFTDFVWFNTVPLDQIDSFEYTKGVWVIIMGVVATVMIAFTQYQKMSKKQKFLEAADKCLLVLWGLYVIMVVISSVTSKYRELAFKGGGYSQWQTMWVLLGYAMLFLYAYLFVDSTNKVRVLFISLLISTTVMAGIGTLQKFGNNPLTWEFLQDFITEKSKIDAISFKKGYSDVVVTFNNPNYTGTYVALMFPIALSFLMAKLSEDKNTTIVFKVLGGLASVGLLCALSGAGSSAGIIAVVASVVFAGVFYGIAFLVQRRKEKTDDAETVPTKDKKKMTLILVCAAVVLVVGGVALSRTTIVKNTITKIVQGDNDTRNFASIVNEDATLKVELRNGLRFQLTPVVSADQNLSVTAMDADKKDIPVQFLADKGFFKLQDERFTMVTIVPKRFSVNQSVYPGFELKDAPNQITWTFMHVDGKWQYYTPFGKFMQLHEVEHFGFEKYQNIANRRGFIWSRTIPLMKKYWFKGVGPNAFIIAFPNDDFVGSKRVGGNTTLVDKPHNTFLQIFVQTGGVSAIAYVGLWILYMCGSLRLFWRKVPSNTVEWLNYGVMIGMLGYAITGLTNDTIIGVQNIYWILLGVGYALIRVIKVERSK